MEEQTLDATQFSDLDLAIIISNPNLFDQNIIVKSQTEWDNRDLEALETQTLINQVKDIITEGKSLASKNKENNMVSFLKTKGIHEYVASAYAGEIKGTSTMTIVASIFIVVAVVRLLFKAFNN